jgi:hypothetical protein
LLIVAQLAFVLPHHPYYFTYYNPLLGGGRVAARTMIVGWGEGMDAAARWLNAQPDAAEMDVVAWYSTTFEPFFRGHAIYKIAEEKISRTPKPGLAADYVILYVNQIQRELPTLGALQFFRAEPPLHTVTLQGIDYAWIYPSVGMQRVIEEDARLVGQAELLGYNLLNEAGRPVTELPANETTTVQLYWEWQGKTPDEPINLSLVDQTGRTWGWGYSLGTEARFPFEQWEEGMVVRDDFVLAVFPGTPPGRYMLNAWIDRPASGEVVGVFPLTLADAGVTVTRPASPPAVEDLGLAQELGFSVVSGIALLGANGTDKMPDPWLADQSHEIVLYWQAEQAIEQNYPVVLSLWDEMGAAQAQWSGPPVGGRFPTDRWQPGDVIRDPWTLTLPRRVPPGDYLLTVHLGPDDEPLNLAQVTVGGRPRNFEVPPPNLLLEARFGPAIELVGLIGPTKPAAVKIIPGQPLEVTLIWRAAELIEADYIVTVQLLDGQNQVRAQRDSAPLNGAAPTSSWAVEEVVPDRAILTIPEEIGPGPHRLLIALYRPETGERLLLADGSDHIEIPAVIE